MRAVRSTPKYQQVYSALRREIQSGQWKRGDRLPSEAELVKAYHASRITVGRAMRELQSEGFVERRAGSGTYVRARPSSGALSFGLLIPDLGETDVFEPICQGMMVSPLAREHALLWGSPNGGDSSKAGRALQLCHHYIDRGVSGVFFAPLEFIADKDEINQTIAEALDQARIPVVLLDRTVVPYPRRGHHDLVGIDNRRAGYVITEHLLHLGCRRIAFVAEPHAAATVDAREAGYREALYRSDVRGDRSVIHRVDPADTAAVRAMMSATRPEAIVCANDRTAGRLMHALRALDFVVPRDVRLVGIDDVPYASLLPVPLTTLRQPTRQIGEAALATMLERVVRPDLPPRDILLHCELVVRESCGGGAHC
jgi:GntR family transcriptional regulator, arabinose operon transcriptional repressor